MSVSGFNSENPRVRWKALQTTGILLTDLAPLFQQKYYNELLPALIKMMDTESEIKVQTLTTSCMIGFIRGLLDDEEDEDSEINVKNRNVIEPFADRIVNSISSLF